MKRIITGQIILSLLQQLQALSNIIFIKSADNFLYA